MPPKYSRQSAPEAGSATSVSCSALPVSSVSSSESSRLRERMMSAARLRQRPRSAGVLAAHSACPCRAAAIAFPITPGVAECSRAIPSPVAG